MVRLRGGRGARYGCVEPAGDAGEQDGGGLVGADLAPAAELEEARQAWSDWQDAWAGVQRAMRSAGMSTARIDAYRVGTGYDEGGGVAIGWSFFQDAAIGK